MSRTAFQSVEDLMGQFSNLEIPTYQIEAFAYRPLQWNPAVVCPLDVWFPDEMLQAIEEENNLAETAFFVAEAGV